MRAEIDRYSARARPPRPPPGPGTPRPAVVRRADAPTFDDALRTYGEDLHLFIARRIRDRDLARDLAQETMLRAYAARRAFDPARPLWPWLCAIARNLVFNAVRDERRRSAIVDRSSDEDLVAVVADPCPGADPERCYLDRHHRLVISAAFDSLTPRQRRLLWLRAGEELSYEDIAAIEGVSIDAVKSVLKRARRSFRSAYHADLTAAGRADIPGGPGSVRHLVLREPSRRLVG